MSKTYGLAGLRIGWVATRNAAVLSRMAELKDFWDKEFKVAT
jgi:histidinol-phosphate/aromatic aminotransferase/cobyric acid decarboxylase-like protein